jgi:hypothetical protein
LAAGPKSTDKFPAPKMMPPQETSVTQTHFLFAVFVRVRKKQAATSGFVSGGTMAAGSISVLIIRP